MRRGIFTAVVALISAGLFIETTTADVVRLKNGNSLEGEIKTTTERQVTIDVPGVGQLTLERNEIVSIEKTTNEGTQEGSSAATVPTGQSLGTELQLVYEKRTKKVTQSEKKGEAAQEQTSNSEILVGLGSNYFYVSEGGKKSIYDFKKRRILYVRDDQKTYAGSSLFSILGFRQAEFQNRLFLKDVFAKALEPSKGGGNQNGLQGNPFNLFEEETIFGLESKDAKKQQIEDKVEDGVHRYVIGGEPVVEYSLTESNLPEQNKDMFGKWVLYEVMLHPIIRRSLLAGHKIPRLLKYRFKSRPDTIYVQLELKGMKENAQSGYSIPSDFGMTGGSEDELDRIIDGIRTKKTTPRLTEQQFIDTANKAFEQGRYLDAMLTLLEYSLQTGEQSRAADEMRKVAPYAKTDKQMALFVNGTNMSSKEATQEALRSLDAIEREGLTRGHVIDIEKADAKMALGETDAAKELFLKVLKINPYITGVWKDLGDASYQTYDTVTAWKCWDTARTLYPHHPMLQQVNQYEQQLLSTYGDFF